MPLQFILRSAILVPVLLLAGQLPAIADDQQDYCIKCTNPDQTYICRVTSAGSQSRGKQFFCIMNIAKEEGHDSCTATAQSGACSGVLKLYEVSGSAPLQRPADNTATKAIISPPIAPEHQNNEPKTLVEFTKQATRATKSSLQSAGNNTGKVIKNTGKAFKKTGIVIKKTGKKIKKFSDSVGSTIGNATKTTFRCITSLFSSCSSE